MARSPESGDELLVFMRLIWAVDHQLQSVSKRMEASHGMTVPQRMTLLLIGRQPGVLASELAELLHLHPGTISGILSRLEAGGWIARKSDMGDARRRQLTLTAKGERANRRRKGTFQEAVKRALAASSRAEIDAASNVLRRLARALGQ